MKTMTKIVQPLSGTSALEDPKNQMYIDLPQGIKVYKKDLDIWLGGNEAGDVLLFVERLNHSDANIPTIIAEGDLDLYLCSESRPEPVNAKIKGVSMAGSFVNRPVKGYLSFVHAFDKMSYLVLIATTTMEGLMDWKALSLDVASRIQTSLDN